MNVLATIFISILTTLVTAWSAYNYLPVSTLDLLQKPKQENFGTTLTEISGSDQISSFPTIHNSNMTNLNNGKMETSTTSVKGITTLASLASIGTITTGVWNGTPVTVPYGGTGSTTLALGLVLTGSTTNAVGTVAGYGTSGQFLTSQGDAKEPQWTTSSINEAGNYTWTGLHNFLSTTVTIKNLYASATAANPFYLNGIDYAFPQTEGASSTVLATNGSGVLSWDTLLWDSGVSSRANGSTGAQAVTHNLGKTPKYIRITAYSTSTVGSGAGIMQSIGTATSTGSQNSLSSFAGIFGNRADLAPTSTRIIWLTEVGNFAACTAENDGSRAYARLTGLTSTTFTLTWDYNCAGVTGAFHYFEWELW